MTSKKKKLPDLAQYRNIVVGSGVRAGMVYGRAKKFLENDLSGKNVAFYVSSSMAGDPGSHDNAKARFVEHTLAKYPNVKAVSTEAFGGRISTSEKPFLTTPISLRLRLGQKSLEKNSPNKPAAAKAGALLCPSCCVELVEVEFDLEVDGVILHNVKALQCPDCGEEHLLPAA